MESTSGRFAPITSAAAAKRVLRPSRVAARFAPASVWVSGSIGRLLRVAGCESRGQFRLDGRAPETRNPQRLRSRETTRPSRARVRQLPVTRRGEEPQPNACGAHALTLTER